MACLAWFQHNLPTQTLPILLVQRAFLRHTIFRKDEP